MNSGGERSEDVVEWGDATEEEGDFSVSFGRFKEATGRVFRNVTFDPTTGMLVRKPSTARVTSMVDIARAPSSKSFQGLYQVLEELKGCRVARIVVGLELWMDKNL